MNTQRLTLDLDKSSVPRGRVTIAQCDHDGTTVEAEIYDNGIALSTSGLSAYLVMRLPDGRHYYRVPATLDGHVATAIVDEAYAATATGTTEIAYFELVGSGGVYSTSRFGVRVLPSATAGATVPETWDGEVERLIQQLDDAIETATDAASVANAAAANADATADGVESRVQEMAQDAAETATADAEQRIQDAIDAMGDISELAVPLMSKDVRGGAKLEEHGGLVLRDEKLGIGSLVQESDGAVRGSIARLTAEGHAEQASTTGKNLLRFPYASGATLTQNGVTFTQNADGSVSAVGTATANAFYNFASASASAYDIEAGTYTISIDKVLPVKTGIIINRRTDGVSYDVATLGSNMLSTLFKPQATGILICYLQVNSGATINVTFYPQLELGSTATPYEPYSGGLPSPRPDWEQPIKVVRGRNLLDSSLLVRQVNSVNRVRYNNRAIHISAGTTLVCSSSDSALRWVVIIISDSSNVATGSGNVPETADVLYDSGHDYGWKNPNTPITVHASGWLAVSFKYDNDSAITPQQIAATNPQLTIGSIPQPYVPYGHVGLEVQGKNLLPAFPSATVNGVAFTANPDGSITANGTATALVTNIVDVAVKAGTYTLSGCPAGGGDSTYRLDNNSGANDTGSGATFSVASNATVRIRIRISSGYTANNLTYYPQLELGSTATEFQPYFEPTCTPIPLPSRGWVGSLPDGTADVLTLDGAGKVEWELMDDKVVLDGSSDESWNAFGNYMSTGGGYYQLYAPRYVTKATAGNNNPGLMCEEASWAELGVSLDNTGKIGCAETSSGSNFRFRLYEESSQNLDNFKAYLAEHPITCMFALTTPVTEGCGYIDLPEIPSDATISIPELDALGVKYFVDDSAGTLARQWYERAYAEIGQAVVDLAQRVAALES